MSKLDQPQPGVGGGRIEAPLPGVGAAIAAVAVAVTLFVQAGGPGAFGYGRGALSQGLGWLLFGGWATFGVAWWRDPLRCSRTFRPAGLLTWVVAGWLAIHTALTGLWAPLAGGAAPEVAGAWLLDWPRLRIVIAVAMAPLVVAGLARATLWSLRAVRSRRGLGLECALGLSSTAVAVWAAGSAAADSSRPALPLGHHNLLALYLTPFSCAALWILLGRREAAVRRRVALLVAGVAGVTVLATGSLAGAFGLAAGTTMAVTLRLREALRRAAVEGRREDRVSRAAVGRLGWLAVATATLLMGAFAVDQGQRIAGVLAGEDASLRARIEYAGAALQGLAERPWFGWGLARGDRALASHLDPTSGALVPGQVVSDTHSLWLDLLVELGGVGFLLLLLPIGLVLLRSASRSWRAEATSVETAALVASGTLCAASLCAGWFDVGALWWLAAASLAVLIAAQVATEPDASVGSAARPARRTGGRALRGIALLTVLATALPDLVARHSAAVATTAAGASKEEALGRTARWGTPLDRLRYALALTTTWEPGAGSQGPPGREAAPRGGGAAVDVALASAVGAVSLAGDQWLHWYVLGEVERRAGRLESARAALTRACDLAPRVPFAAWSLSRLASAEPAKAALVRALLAEPRLAAALELSPGERSAAVATIERLENVPLGWRAAVAEAAATVGDSPAPADAPLAALDLWIDQLPETSVSLFLERRQPLPVRAGSVTVRLDLAERFALEPAARLADLRSEVWRPGCQLAGPADGFSGSLTGDSRP